MDAGNQPTDKADPHSMIQDCAETGHSAEDLEELEWDAIVSTPKSQAFLEHLAAEARHEIAAGLTRESAESW